MDFFSLLREHAHTRTDAVAVASPRRSMTYRKLWSRIERATARLQMEWGVVKGDTVVYHGDSHPDALVLYFALARCGACLLPLSSSFRAAEKRMAERFSSRLLVADDELFSFHSFADYPVKTLSSLIATPSPREPVDLMEDPFRPALLIVDGTQAEAQAYSLVQLAEEGAGATDVESRVDKLFAPGVLSRQVLPVLQKGSCLYLP